ncbi:MAG: hypothetical protein ACKO2P_13945 [Planctomycetota bacterium]
MFTGADGCEKFRVSSECCGESFEALEFVFELLQFASVLLVSLCGELPADESGGELDGGEH